MLPRNHKPPWDIVENMDERRARSLHHLSALAAEVVKDTLGPSQQQAEQQAEEKAEEERYRLDLQRWEEDQADLRGMSQEEYDRAVRSGVVRQYPERRKLAPESQADMDAWLRRRISERLTNKIDAVLLELVGIEQSFGGSLRLKRSGETAFGARLAEKAKAMATEVADKWVADNASLALKEMEIDDLLYRFRHELEAATKKAIADRIAIIAKERAAHVHSSVLEAAVDKAMFDAYPILRRMDAAERLGAKTEDTA